MKGTFLTLLKSFDDLTIQTIKIQQKLQLDSVLVAKWPEQRTVKHSYFIKSIKYKKKNFLQSFLKL